MSTATALLIGLALIAVSIVVLAWRVSRALTITVQAPVAQMPDDVRATLNELNEKMRPKLLPMSPEALNNLVYEGVAVAERSKLKGPDRFRIAKKFVLERAAAQLLTVDEADVARQIEAAVAVNNKGKR